MEEAKKQLRATMAHTQVRLCYAQEALGSKIKLERSGELVHVPGEEWPTTDDIKKCGEISRENLGEADLTLCFSHRVNGVDPGSDFGGIGYVGVACRDITPKFKCQLNMWSYTAPQTAGVSPFLEIFYKKM